MSVRSLHKQEGEETPSSKFKAQFDQAKHTLKADKSALQNYAPMETDGNINDNSNSNRKLHILDATALDDNWQTKSQTM